MASARARGRGSTGRRLLGGLRAAPGLCVLLAGLIVYNLGQVLSLLIRPLSSRAFRGYNRAGADLWWRTYAALARLLHGVRIELGGDPLPGRENALIVANHQQMTDICFLEILACRCRAAGDTKWFVKRSIRHVPFLGWGMLFLDNVFVARSWSRDRASIEATFARLIRHRVPLWLMLFAEGTRLTPEKLARSQRIQERKGQPVTEHVLLPRTRGFTAAVQGLRGHLDAVYDTTIGYPGGAPTLGDFILGEAPVAHLHVRRYPVEELPRDDAGLDAWLRQRFVDKDRLLAAFARDGLLRGDDQ